MNIQIKNKWSQTTNSLSQNIYGWSELVCRAPNIVLFVSTFSQKVVIVKVSVVFYFCEKKYYLGNYDIKKISPPPLDLAALLFGLLTLHFF